MKEFPKALIASRGDFLEPFHGVYNTDQITKIERLLYTGSGSIFSLLKDSGVLKIPDRIVKNYCPDGRIFENVNRPEDTGRLRTLHPYGCLGHA